ncbi:hypothetical protein K450DRAFT_252501 [Umbelopsis ramanniana AG]|uniref:ATPase inhibitor, mitochondrial n=1 Tax=Umbelopsis ramanniana AG TaxID=1314678 RepID=A0AAD5E604_UMBRA|nr:uncharacterized protein K450DRAFT_252501 [Umbelopsis ramanniana AG]KAI8577294.1 hypothetical protein K450DRAFT_252501 [Umbelopsis ramanniana AG]
MIRTTIRRISSNTQMIKRLSSGGPSEGATVTSKGGISDKEKAVENQWARLHDAEKIKALRDALQKQTEATESLKKDIEELKKGAK